MASETLIKFAEKKYNSRDIISVFLHLAIQEIFSLGINLILQTDFERLLQINKKQQKTWFPLMPMFNHNYCDQTLAGNAFWIEGQNDDGETCLVQCARLYSLPCSSLKSEIESLHIFYDDPNKDAAPGEKISCTSPSAPHISRQICYSGGAWLHPQYRSIGLMGILPRISRSLALLMWDTDYTVSFVEKVLIQKGVINRYGYRLAEPGIQWRNSKIHGNLDLNLIWMDTPMLVKDLASAIQLKEIAAA